MVKKDSIIAYLIQYFVVLVTGIWTGGWLFHLIPVGHLDSWWEMPWAYTVVAISVAVGGLVVYIVNKLLVK